MMKIFRFLLTQRRRDAKVSASRSDWARIDAMRNEDINTSDVPPLSDEFFSKAQLRMPKSINTNLDK